MQDVLDFHVMGHFVLHDLVGRTGINGVVGEHGLEVGFGHAGPADEVLAGIDGEVCEEFFDGFEPVVIMTMSRFGEPDEVVRSVVELVTIKMMALLSFSRDTPSCGTDEPVCLSFFPSDSEMQVFATTFT